MVTREYEVVVNKPWRDCAVSFYKKFSSPDVEFAGNCQYDVCEQTKSGLKTESRFDLTGKVPGIFTTVLPKSMRALPDGVIARARENASLNPDTRTLTFQTHSTETEPFATVTDNGCVIEHPTDPTKSIIKGEVVVSSAIPSFLGKKVTSTLSNKYCEIVDDLGPILEGTTIPPTSGDIVKDVRNMLHVVPPPPPTPTETQTTPPGPEPETTIHLLGMDIRVPASSVDVFWDGFRVGYWGREGRATAKRWYLEEKKAQMPEHFRLTPLCLSAGCFSYSQ